MSLRFSRQSNKQNKIIQTIGDKCDYKTECPRTDYPKGSSERKNCLNLCLAARKANMSKEEYLNSQYEQVLTDIRNKPNWYTETFCPTMAIPLVFCDQEWFTQVKDAIGASLMNSTGIATAKKFFNFLSCMKKKGFVQCIGQKFPNSQPIGNAWDSMKNYFSDKWESFKGTTLEFLNSIGKQIFGSWWDLFKGKAQEWLLKNGAFKQTQSSESQFQSIGTGWGEWALWKVLTHLLPLVICAFMILSAFNPAMMASVGIAWSFKSAVLMFFGGWFGAIWTGLRQADAANPALKNRNYTLRDF